MPTLVGLHPRRDTRDLGNGVSHVAGQWQQEDQATLPRHRNCMALIYLINSGPQAEEGKRQDIKSVSLADLS